MKRIGIAMLGVAHPHADHWAKAWRIKPEANLVGAFDYDSARCKAWAAENEVKAYASIEEALSDPDVSAVGICAENSLHMEYACKAALAGKDILCEKPTATTLEECDRISAAVKDAGVRYMQAFPMRVDPVNYQIKGYIDSGLLGKITLVRKRHGIGWAAANAGNVPAKLQWFTDKKIGGGGALLDEGIHAMDFLNWMFGNPLKLQSMIPESATGLDVEDNASVMLEFKDNVIAVLQTSWTFRAGTNTTEIFGTEGSLIQQFNDCASTTVNGESNFPLQVYSTKIESGWWMPRTPTIFQEIHEKVAERFIDCLVSGEEFPSTIDNGRNALKMVLMAYEAARTGKTIKWEDM